MYDDDVYQFKNITLMTGFVGQVHKCEFVINL